MKYPIVVGLLVLLVVAQAPAPAEANNLALLEAMLIRVKTAAEVLAGYETCSAEPSNLGQFAGVLKTAGIGSQSTVSTLGARSAARGHHKCDWSPPDTNYKQLPFDFRIAGAAIVDLLNPVTGKLDSRFTGAAGGFLSGDAVFPVNAALQIDQGFDSANATQFLEGLVDFVQDGAWAAGYAATPYTLDPKDITFKTSANNGSPLNLTSFAVSEFDRSLLSIGAVASIGGPVKGKYSLTKTKVDIDEGDDIFGFESSQCYVAYIQTTAPLTQTFTELFFTAYNTEFCQNQTFPALCGLEVAFAATDLLFVKCAVFYVGELTYSKSNPYFENYFTATQSINSGNLGTFASRRNNLVCGKLRRIGNGKNPGGCAAVPPLPKSSSGKGNKLL